MPLIVSTVWGGESLTPSSPPYAGPRRTRALKLWPSTMEHSTGPGTRACGGGRAG